MNWKYIMLHCTATPEGRMVKTTEIDAWHRERGFNGIGYHYVVHQDGRIEAGRPLSRSGAHCTGYNSVAIGIVYVGGLNGAHRPADTRTPQQKEAIVHLIHQLKKNYHIERIMGHNEVSAKACPCFNVKKEFSNDEQ